MNKNDHSKILSLGQVTSFTVDPDIKMEINKKQIESISSEIKKHLLKNKKVHVVIVKE